MRQAPVGQGAIVTKCRIYIDEVGNPDLGSAELPNHRFLSLTGVIAALDHVRDVIHPDMEALKALFFRSHPDEPLILHRKELVNAHHPFKALRDPGVRAAFDEALLNLLSRWEYAVVTVVIDKLEHLNQYRVWRYDPYHYCLRVLLERYLFYLEQSSARGDALSESRSAREDRRLKASYRRLWCEGTDYVEASRFQARLTSRELKVKPKRYNIACLQLADLLAHPSRRETLLEQGKIQDSRADIFADRIVRVLAGKYYQKAGRVTGYGKKTLP